MQGAHLLVNTISKWKNINKLALISIRIETISHQKWQNFRCYFGSTFHKVFLQEKFVKTRKGWGHWAVYSTSPKSFITMFLYSLAQQLWGITLKFDWLVYRVYKLLIVIYRRGNFVYHHWGGTSIYRPLYNPFTSLD